MTVRLNHLVLPLAHKATAMRTIDTTGSSQDRSSAITPLIGSHLRQGDVDSKNLTIKNIKAHNLLNIAVAMFGIGVLSVAANSRKVPSFAAFLRLAISPMGGLDGESQDSQVPHLYANPSSSVHPIGVGCSVKRTMRRHTMSESTSKPIRTTKEHPFFSCSVDSQSLFKIKEGVELDDAINQASCFLASALKITEDLAFENDSAQAWACHYLVEISKAIVDSLLINQMQEATKNG